MVRLIAACALTLTVACGVTSGTITSKSFEPGHWTLQSHCVHIGNNPCAVVEQVPRWRPDCWRLNLQDGDRAGAVCVSYAEWFVARVGQHWPPRPVPAQRLLPA